MQTVTPHLTGPLADVRVLDLSRLVVGTLSWFNLGGHRLRVLSSLAHRGLVWVQTGIFR